MSRNSDRRADRTSRSVLQRRILSLAAPGIARLLRSTQQARRDQFAALGAPADRIVFLGDSISEYGLWEEWFPGVPVLNRGIGGETSAQVATRLDSAINAPLAVLLLIGTNDLPPGTPVAAIAANVRAIVAGIEQRAPGTPVVLQSVMPRALAYRNEVTELNRRLVGVVDTAGPQVEYLDLWPTLATPSGALRPEYTLDALHLNGAGYRAWTDLLTPLIERFTPTHTKDVPA